MARTTILTDNWSRGRISDLAPNKMPPNSAQALTNFLVDIGLAPLLLRGGTEYAYQAHADFTFFSASSTSISAIAYGGFSDGPQIVAVDQAGRILSLNQSGVGSLLAGTGLAEAANTRPFWHRDRLIVPGSSGGKFPWAVTTNGSGTASASAFVDPFPKAKYGASWLGSYLLMANGGDFANSYAINLRRMWFSDPGALTYTSANNSYIDWPDEILAVIPMTGYIVGIGTRKMWLMTGTTPPSSGVTSDLIMRDLYTQGTIDQRSVNVWNGYILFANASGIWKTDGTMEPVNITSQAGLATAWRNDMYSFGAGWTCAAGIYQDYYIVTITNASGVEVATYVFDLGKSPEVGFNFSGLRANMYASVQSGLQTTPNSAIDLLMAPNNLAQITRLQPCFQRGGVAGKDANGVVIPWQLITPFYMLGDMESKRIRRVWMSYDWSNTAPFSDTPTIQYAVSTSPFSGASTWVNLSAPPAGSGRQPLFVNSKGRWVSFNFQGGGTNGTNNFALYGLDAEGRLHEQSRSDTT